MILLDTHVLLWWSLDPGKLSERAAEACGSIPKTGGMASSISLWEIGLKVKRGLELGMTTTGYAARLKIVAGFEILPVDEEMWLKNLELPWEHRDPADRTIVATALLKKIPLVTCDQAITQSGLVTCVW
jgi:PIN domain nuclease of toxin-antitoxin system